MEDAWQSVYEECGFQVERQVAVPVWDRFRWTCGAPGCGARGRAWPRPASCSRCGAEGLAVEREEAVLDLEVRGPDLPRLYADVTVRHGVPSPGERLARAAAQDGAVNDEAERDKADRYPSDRSPWNALPLACETYGRLGLTALRQLRRLARVQAARLDDGGRDAASSLLQRWGCRLSVALHRANAANLQRSLGVDVAALDLKRCLEADFAN